MRGRFITFEGGEGSGKSTHARLLADRLNSHGIEVVLTREPGGSPGAEIIRHILLSGIAKPLGAETEAILFAAARDDHVRATIRPALEAGKWVMTDRFEAESVEFHEELRRAYIALADKEPKRCVLVDGRAPRDVVAERIWTAVEQRLHPGLEQLAATATP